MKEYALLFRMDITNPDAQPTEEQMDIYMDQWNEWINDIVEEGQLADGGGHFSKQGRVLRPNNKIDEQPYTDNNSSLAGFIIVLSDDMEGATAIARRCPILNGENTSVEIRALGAP